MPPDKKKEAAPRPRRAASNMLNVKSDFSSPLPRLPKSARQCNRPDALLDRWRMAAARTVLPALAASRKDSQLARMWAWEAVCAALRTDGTGGRCSAAYVVEYSGGAVADRQARRALAWLVELGVVERVSVGQRNVDTVYEARLAGESLRTLRAVELSAEADGSVDTSEGSADTSGPSVDTSPRESVRPPHPSGVPPTPLPSVPIDAFDPWFDEKGREGAQPRRGRTPVDRIARARGVPPAVAARALKAASADTSQHGFPRDPVAFLLAADGAVARYLEPAARAHNQEAGRARRVASCPDHHQRHMAETDDGRPVRCPACHPGLVEGQACCHHDQPDPTCPDCETWRKTA